ncbi:MAG: hypothetical protein ABSA72_08855 [Nitrososphaerales archaeon]|jgi:hypothetical protein
MDLLNRYRAGDYLTVWDELRNGDAEPTEAAAVCDATMQRVSENVDVIVDYLDATGYRFAYPDLRRHPPTPDDLHALDNLHARVGAIPSALRSCLAIVGEVWLCGTFSDSDPPMFAFEDLSGYPMMTDPLVLPSGAWVDTELQEWDSNDWSEPKRPWRLDFAPDELHKAGISGATHDLLLPDENLDPVLLGVEGRSGITLVEYLRVSMTWGGFPGFQFIGRRPPLVEALQQQLQPF